MRFTTCQYLEKEVVTVSIRNNNASVAILDGQPVYADNNNVTSVNLGVDVKNFAEALGSSPHGMFIGICKTNKVGGLVAGDVGEAVVYGFTDAIRTARTRATSTDTYASVATFGAGDQLIGESVGSAVQRLGPIGATLAIPSGSTGQTVTVPVPAFLFAGESQASIVSNASTSTDTKIADTYRMKVFVRAM